MELYTLRLSLEEDKDASIARFISDLNRDIADQLELYPYTTYEDICHLATKIENQRKRISFSKTNLPLSKNVMPKSQASTHKSWPKKEYTPKVAFKDHSKPKVEEKERLITNPTRCFKCNSVNVLILLLTVVIAPMLLKTSMMFSLKRYSMDFLL
ncbi:hypothetical protein M9H77_31017 [Catharanthus roseus]|uniref:Uncharacterized protein n=1 Tax=Catharanthus roseus TaxID=4058 RepID=A0ACB9ZYV8_CATRO|nr:hypothetical protein M9H77_31017 [Catharanthus roseus]